MLDFPCPARLPVPPAFSTNVTIRCDCMRQGFHQFSIAQTHKKGRKPRDAKRTKPDVKRDGSGLKKD
jgi:hypothetical protein